MSTNYDLNQRPPRGGLLTLANPKLTKGETDGYLTAGLCFAPAKMGGYDVCPYATDGCTNACLNKSGHGAIGLDDDGLNAIQVARIRRKLYFRDDREGFLADLVREIGNFERRAAKLGYLPAIRLNTLSDVRWEVVECVRDGESFPNLMEAFPAIKFYDYTKWPTAKRRKLCPDWPSNYSLTFSLSETNGELAAAELAAGTNVAVPFTTSTAKVTRDGKRIYRDSLPPSAMLNGQIAAVIDGDLSDLRFTDPQGVIVGLRAKGTAANKAEGARAGFILQA